MVTAAIGAEEFYTLETNSARTETPEQSAALDKRLQDAWTGHPHMRIVDNSTDFEGKIRQVLQHVSQAVGIPQPYEAERRFLVESDEIPVYHVTASIRQDYLVGSNPNVVGRVRRWESRGHRSYTHTEKEVVGKGKAIERERKISSREYCQILISNGDKSLHTIEKERTCFVYEGQHMELDRFQGRLKGLRVLEVELPSIEHEVHLPPWIKGIQEITGNHSWSNRALAEKLPHA